MQILFLAVKKALKRGEEEKEVKILKEDKVLAKEKSFQLDR